MRARHEEKRYHMGLLEGFSSSFQHAFKSGADAAEKTTRKLKLKASLSDAKHRLRTSQANLGADVYQETKDDVTFRSGREELYTAIENAQREVETLEAEIAFLNLPDPAPEDDPVQEPYTPNTRGVEPFVEHPSFNQGVPPTAGPEIKD